MGRETKRKKKFKFIPSPAQGQRGTVIVYVGILIIVLLGFGALAVDIGHLYVARNELQDAADAGALAGAGRLYVANGTAVNDGTAGIPSANQFAYNAAIANTSQNTAVEVQWAAGSNTGDIQRGHWSFAARQFTPSDNLTPPVLWDHTTAELDADTSFVNAVRVVTRRESTPVAMTFARIFGFPTYPVTAEAVAYLGFAGRIEPNKVDEPLAICKQAITAPNGSYTCVTGREINSGTGGGGGGHNTSAWTNFSQPCTTANPPTTNPLICAEGNPYPIIFGDPMGSTNGMVDSVYKNLYNCWVSQSDKNGDGVPDTPWPLRLPVIDCGSSLTVTNCMTVVGYVEITVLWMETAGGVGQITYPRAMGDWSCPGSMSNSQCWNSFATHFEIKDWNNTQILAPSMKSIYFKPDCTYHQPEGTTGGANYGILAKIPVLVAPPRN